MSDIVQFAESCAEDIPGVFHQDSDDLLIIAAIISVYNMEL
jgi:hypothetical protein